MKLVIVESPTKAKTISRFLGKGFTVKSSYGHVRDLPAYKLGIDLENNFEPQYVIPKKSAKIVKDLKSELKNADTLILATDEDREGEAIAWHLLQALDVNGAGAKKKKKDADTPKIPPKIERIVFHEITKPAIEKALSSPRNLDLNMIDAQQARRVLDRLVGYKLSPFLWKKLMRGLSAGRVQSVALRIIVEREKEIKAFLSQKYWQINALLKKTAATETNETFPAQMTAIDDKPIEKPGLLDENETQKILTDLNAADWKVASIEKRRVEKTPKPPFTTSSLQQEAWSRLHFSAKKTMMIAQQLYEGVELKNKGQLGLITYMRTDSVNIAGEALAAASAFIKQELGEKYSLPEPRVFKTKSKTAQEAHEAIRPTHPDITPKSIKTELSRDQFVLYEIIWQRFIASQMAPAVFDGTTAIIDAANASAGRKYSFHSSGQIMLFDGYIKIYPIKTEDSLLPNLQENDALTAEKIESSPHETEPPPRYTEASLVKTLEKFGIGRPSTYAPIISTIQDRGYVTKNDAKSFLPTEMGEKVDNILLEHFPQIVDIDFTAKMEESLDQIASGEKAWRPTLKEFYEPFEKHLKEKYETVAKQNLTEPTDEKCDKCGAPLIIRYGRFGRFMACSAFPECKFTKALPPVSLNIKCPKCGDGDVIERRTKKRRLFYGCSNYPKCDFATWQKPTGKLCIECSSPLVELKSGIKCSNKNCKFKEGEK
ncbi:MAG: type I DNA topoisomerase [Candidatus Niyogibacteria bacterium]|nr:type I DNA topoisomerase [Candidatus Niyogibacteria bacterium]